VVRAVCAILVDGGWGECGWRGCGIPHQPDRVDSAFAGGGVERMLYSIIML
jgi:hypothetical protein